MNQDNELARILRQNIEFAEREIAHCNDELKRAKMKQARDSLLDELNVVKERLRG